MEGPDARLTSGTKIIRSCSASFDTNAPEYNRPVGRYHHLHKQQQQQHTAPIPPDTSALASAVRIAANIGLTVTDSTGSETSPTLSPHLGASPTHSQHSLSSSNHQDLPYILRSIR